MLEEFGLPAIGPITLPVDASFLEYLLSLLKFRVPMEIERAALVSISNCRCITPTLLLGELHKQQVVL
ncbi:hypothetical protein KSP40_PGU003800 [Platanthera guangdongensis]|uniref:Uncharacterized protein n=1 Tax=Platanthera guangdongensis TaxID=2320717 RepID=A0ABR2M8L5_9ASPA